VALLLGAIVNAATNAPPWMAALPGLSFLRAASSPRATETGQSNSRHLVALAAFCLIVAGFAVGLSSARLARCVGDYAARIISRLKSLIRKAPVTWNGEGFVGFRGEAIVLIRARWWYLTLARSPTTSRSSCHSSSLSEQSASGPHT
jgi:hypothetical protein